MFFFLLVVCACVSIKMFERLHGIHGPCWILSSWSRIQKDLGLFHIPFAFLLVSIMLQLGAMQALARISDISYFESIFRQQNGNSALISMWLLASMHRDPCIRFIRLCLFCLSKCLKGSIGSMLDLGPWIQDPAGSWVSSSRDFSTLMADNFAQPNNKIGAIVCIRAYCIPPVFTMPIRRSERQRSCLMLAHNLVYA